MLKEDLELKKNLISSKLIEIESEQEQLQ